MIDKIALPSTAERIVAALSWGGFASFIPSVFESPWEKPTPPMAGFPISICYTGLPRDRRPDDGETYLVSTYWFDPASYHEDDELRAMTYRARAACNYRVVLGYAKKEHCWEGRKLRGTEAIIAASGPELVRFAIQLTLPSLDPGEPAEPMLTRRETASAGIWIFKPDHPRARTLQ